MLNRFSAWGEGSFQYWTWADLSTATLDSTFSDQKHLFENASQTERSWTGDREASLVKRKPLPPPPPVDPKSWPFKKKLFHTALPAFHGFVVTMGTSVYAPGVESIAEHFHVNQEVSLLGLALYSLGLGLGPLLAAPISETLGRKGVYVVTGVLFLLFNIGAALSQDIVGLIFCRLLSAVFGSPALAVSAGTIADVWDMAHGGGVASVLLTSTYFLGPFIGPTIGGYALQNQHTWRWLLWATAIAFTPILIATLFTEETYLKQIKKRHHKKHGIKSAPSPRFLVALKGMLVGTLLRPLKMLAIEPIVTTWALYHSFIFGVLYAFFDSYYHIFGMVYHFSLGQVGLTFLGNALGMLMAVVTFIIINKKIYLVKMRQCLAGQKPPPEERLYICMLGAIGLPISLFWFAWTAKSDIHWISPVLAGVPFGWACLCLFLGGITYLLDTFGAQFAASAMAANGIARYLFGMAFPLFSTQMYGALGIQWATSLLAFVALALLPIPFVLYKFGMNIRAKSKFVKMTTGPPR